LLAVRVPLVGGGIEGAVVIVAGGTRQVRTVARLRSRSIDVGIIAAIGGSTGMAHGVKSRDVVYDFVV
jgi:hypothetical protein